MKTELTVEQSQRLIELGVDANKASKEMATTIGEQEYSAPLHPIFTLTDLLRILPKWIKYRNRLLELQCWISPYFNEVWCAAYKDEVTDIDEADTFQSSYELIDTLYELTIWIIENKHLFN